MIQPPLYLEIFRKLDMNYDESVEQILGKYGDLLVQLPRERSSDSPEVKGGSYALAESYHYCLIKLRFFYTLCMCVLIYAATVNIIAIYVSNKSYFKNYSGSEIMIQSVIPVIIFAIIISLYYIYLKKIFLHAKLRTINLSIFVFQIISCALLPLFSTTFTTAKNLLGYFNTYQWDEYFSIIDKYLHDGTDPWIIYFPVLQTIGFVPIDAIYFQTWVTLSLLVPIFVLLFESSLALRVRFFVGYGVVWIGLGNFVAGIFLSAGPVYYGYMTGDADRFSEFFTAINAYGFQNTGTPRVQEMLWNYHVEGQANFGSGISAFPSVHVGMAMLIGLYLWSKLGRFGAVALLFPLAIQIFSVLLGWHYAVDGYFSIAVVLVAWYFCAYRYTFGERPPDNLLDSGIGDDSGEVLAPDPSERAVSPVRVSDD